MPHLAEALAAQRPVIAVELRPPRATLDARAGMDAWIDTYHAVRRLSRNETFVFLTDSAVGSAEEDNLRHLVTNIGADVPRDRVVPFLTAKHTLEYCLGYADRAAAHGFPALVVLGGDRTLGPPRSVEHAWQLREAVRARQPALSLGGWANPHKDPDQQIDYLLDARFSGEFYLTQVVSHHDAARVDRFVATAQRRRLALPGIFGVFYYRSAKPATLAALSEFLPVPAGALTREFAAGASPEDICARSIAALLSAGATHFYISNLPLATAGRTLADILERIDLPN